MNKTKHNKGKRLKERKMETYKPGQVVEKTGNYHSFNSIGHNEGKLHLEKGEKFPANKRANNFYVADAMKEQE